MPRYYDDEPIPLDHDDCDEPRPRRRYRCSDGFCGASDCDRCHPGHDEEGEE